MIPIDDAGESLDSHWAIAVFEPADRKELLGFAENVRRQILSGDWIADSPVPEQLLPLSGAYELAASSTQLQPTCFLHCVSVVMSAQRVTVPWHDIES